MPLALRTLDDCKVFFLQPVASHHSDHHLKTIQVEVFQLDFAFKIAISFATSSI